MIKAETDWERIFWTTLTVSFVLLVHNGAKPLFLLAMALLPFLILLFYFKRSFWPLVFYLLIFGALGRYMRYWRQTYASDTLLAIRDYIGFLLAGKNPYNEMVMCQSGPTPFTYLPFALFWYLLPQVNMIDLRFFEMLVSCLVPVLVFLYGFILRKWKVLPIVAVVALTPFLLDLAADGSNDNSAVFLLLAAMVLLVWSKQKKSRKAAVYSAIVLGLAASFKHYLAFYLIYFLSFVWKNKKFLVIPLKKYLLFFLGTVGIISLPFIIFSPGGFYRSLVFIERTSWHQVWGWNVWVVLRDSFGLIASRTVMWWVRTLGSLAVIFGLFGFFKLEKLNKVFIATSVTMLTYLTLSEWTTYAYFTFLVPLLGLSAINIEEKK